MERRSIPMLRTLALVLLSVGLAGCSQGSQPASSWVHLAKGFRPAQGVGDGDGEAWIETRLEPGDWRPGPWSDSWLTDPPFPGTVRTIKYLEIRLWVGDVAYERRTQGSVRRDQELPPGQFVARRKSLCLRLPPGDGPPRDVRLAMRLNLGRSVGGRWRTEIGGATGEGLVLWPGQETVVEGRVPAGGVLRFQAVGQAFAADSAASGKLVCRIRWEGEVRHEFELSVGAETTQRWLSLDLPPGDAPGRLSFDLEGPGWMALLSPTVGPRVLGAGARRPDVVLFLADTFRADNLGIYGGSPETTPHLNALVEESVRFRRVWSPAAWTLPSQISMLTACFPPQHGGTNRNVGLSRDLTTVAEHLAAFGYRTGAVVDSGIVSRVYGFDEGFEWFYEISDRKLSRTLRAASDFLAASDGRPTFLFVQTYRTHVPYRTGSDEDDAEYAAIARDANVFQHDVTPEQAEQLLEIYRRGATALDLELDAWALELAERRFFDTGYLIFTSDHGEAFLEHGLMGHGDSLWEEMLRVPLLVRGPDLTPGYIDWGVSLVDLPKTVAEMAGVPAAPLWGGDSILSVGKDRDVYSFDAGGVSVVSGRHKIVARGRGGDWNDLELVAAFDLEADPGELEDLAGRAPWADEVLERVRASIGERTEVRADPSQVELSEEHDRDLRALGYADGD